MQSQKITKAANKNNISNIIQQKRTKTGLTSTRLEAPGVKERKLAGWGLSRGKAWKGSLNVTEKKKRPPNGSQHGHHAGRAHDETCFFLLYLKAIKATQMEW